MVAAALAMALASCGGPGPTIPVAGQTPSRSETPAADGLALPDSGRPFDAVTIIEAMRDSRRPGGVPDELETDAIAAALAEEVWTVDGEPWATMSTGGSCGPQTCTLEVAGAATGAQGEDLWVFEVSPNSGDVRIVSADLRSLPSELIGQLDALTRALSNGRIGADLSLTNVRWLPPPHASQFVISYRSGGEEGSCGADITVDALVPSVVSERVLDC
ncbi:MAG: hypothetical protein M3406_03595 [Chloroflexota bacterium]|nr:hypothetical protein [Chloroflexota bacterium]